MTTGVDPGDRKERRRAEVRARLRRALQGLAADHPFGDIRVSDITDAAGLSRSAFYFYYDDIRSLLLEAVGENVQTLFDEANHLLISDDGDPREAIRLALERHATAWLRHLDLVRMTIEASIYDEGVRLFWRGIVEEFISAVAQRVSAGQERGEIAGDLDADHCAEFLVIATEGYFYRHITQVSGDLNSAVGALIPIWSKVLAA